MVGNVYEWTAGQLYNSTGYDNGMDGLWLGQSFHATSTNVSTIGKYDLLRGLPKASGAAAISSAAANGDYYGITTSGLMGSFRGGNFDFNADAGRWLLAVNYAPSASSTYLGGRCAR